MRAIELGRENHIDVEGHRWLSTSMWGPPFDDYDKQEFI